MKVAGLILIALVSCLLLEGTSAGAGSDDIDRLRAGVVKIATGEPASRTGAGIVVWRGFGAVDIVTAAHVVHLANAVSVQFAGSTKLWTAEVKNIEEDTERHQGLALLSVRGELPLGVRAVPLAPELVVSGGEAVTVVGHQPATGEWGILNGTVANRHGRELRIQVPIDELNSGGPVFLGGRVLGLVQSRAPSGAIALATTASAIHEYLVGHRKASDGGAVVLGGTVGGGIWNNTAEHFDARSHTWRPFPALPDKNACFAQAVVLRDGRVLVAGGGGPNGCGDDRTTTKRTAWYQPLMNDWEAPDCTGPGACMKYGRNNFPALTLRDGRAFVYGGCAGGCVGPNAYDQTLDNTDIARVAEIFDPERNTWSQTPPSRKARAAATAIELPDARVLVCGGSDGRSAIHDDCELYDLNTPHNAKGWSKAGRMPHRVAPHPQLALLEGSTVLGIGNGQWWTWAQTGDYWQAGQGTDVGTWTIGGSLPIPVQGGVLTWLSDGRVLLTGGTVSDRPSRAAQVFSFDARTRRGFWTTLADMKQARTGHVALELETGEVLVAGGCGERPMTDAELYDPKTGRWSEVDALSRARCLAIGFELRKPH